MDAAFADLDIDDIEPLGLDQMARAGIAFEMSDRRKQRTRQQHRVAALALMRGPHHRSAAGFAERIDQTVEVG